MKKILFFSLAVLWPAFAFADVSVNLDVEAPNGTLYMNTISVAPCPVTDDPATTTVSAKCALEQAGLNPQWTNFGGDDWFLTAAGGVSQDFANNLFWNWWNDLSYGQTALNKHELVSGESILVALGVLPLRIEVPPAVTVGATTTVTIEEFGFDSSFNGIWTPSANAAVNMNGVLYETNALGTIDFAATSTDPITLAVSKDNFVPFTLTLAPVDVAPVVSPAPIVSSGGGGGVVTSVAHSRLDTPSALAYLAANQQADGSFDAPFLSDWAALAFAAADSGAKGKLHDYMLSATPSLSSATDYERHALALEALGINPYSGATTDYIAPIIDAFDGTQIGDAHLDNDDIFALFPLLHAGYGTGDAVIQKTTAFILSAQGGSGAWDNSVDMTAAAIQALSAVNSLPNVSSAIGRAESYLRLAQQADGGFGNSFSTSWALQAIVALQESVAAFTSPSGYTPQDYLAALQQSDGGIEPASSPTQTRVWATAYGIPAALGRTWGSLLKSFPKAKSGTGVAQVASPVLSAATSSPATSTPSVTPTSTSTPPLPAVAPRAVASQNEIRAETRVQPQTVEATSSAAQISLAEGKNQTAAVANSGLTAFFARLWNGIVSFVRSIL